MPDKDSPVIQPGIEAISPTVLQSDQIVFDDENSQALIQILRRIPAILDIVKKLTAEKTYRLCIAPKFLRRIADGSARLAERDHGLTGAWIVDRETGHIIHHPGLEEIPPDLLGSLNQLAVQQTLADMARRLEVIDGKITDVLQGQFNDRLAEVESGIHIYEQAVVAANPETRRALLGNAIQKLNEGRNQLIKSTDFRFMDQLPRSKTGMWFFTLKHGDIPKHVQSKAEPIWKAAQAIVEASRYLVLAYSALNEPESLRVSLEQVRSDVRVFQDNMGEMVNWLPPTSEWRESLLTISQGVLPDIRELDEIPQKIIMVEFQPKQMTNPEEIDHENLQGGPGWKALSQ